MTQRYIKHFLSALSIVFLSFSWINNNAYAQSGLQIAPTSEVSTVFPNPVSGQSWLFNSTTKTIAVYNGSGFYAVSQPFSNLSASVAPTVNNDNTQGYVVGSFWFNQSTSILYMAGSVATGAANWVAINAIVTTIPLSQLAQTGATAGQSILWNGSTLQWSPGNPSVNVATNATGILPKVNGGTGVNNTSITANTIFAGPTSGSAAASSFRALVAADIPAITLSQLQQSGATTSQVPSWNGSQWVPATLSGTGTLTNITSGNFSPLFTVSITNPTSTPALAFTAANAASNTIFSNVSGSSAPGAFNTLNLTAGAGLTGGGNLATSPTIAMILPVSSTNGGTGVNNTSITANTVFAGPTSGGAGASSFRSLVSADIPWATPGTIGSTTPSSGAFTTLNASGNTVLGGTCAITGATTIGSGTGMNHFSGTYTGLEVDTGTAGRLLTLQADSIQAIGAGSVGAAVTQGGTGGSSTWTYTIVGTTYNGTKVGSVVGSTATFSGNLNLTGTNFNHLDWSATGGFQPTIQTYSIYRSQVPGGGTPTTLGLIGSTTGSTFNDTGLAGDSTSPFTGNTTGSYLVGLAETLNEQPGTKTVQQSPFTSGTGNTAGLMLSANYTATGITNVTSPAIVHTGNILIQPLATPSTPTVNPVGTTGSTTYSYIVSALMADNTETAGSPVGQTTTGNATLTGSNYNTVSWTAVPGAKGYAVYRLDVPSGNYYLISAPTMPVNAGTTSINNIAGSLNTNAQAPTSNNTGAILWTTDNSGSIGSLGANRPHDIFMAGGLHIGGHILGTSATTKTAGTGAGTSPTISLSANSNDVDGVVTVTTGSTPSASAIIVTITFANAYSFAPSVVFSPANGNAAALSGNAAVYVTPATGNFTLNVGSSALAGATTYIWNYHVAL